MRIRLIAFLLLVTLSSAYAQRKFSYSDMGKFASKTVYGVRSMNDGLHYTTQSIIDSIGTGVVKYSYESGKPVDTLFSTVGRSDVKSFVSYLLNADETKLLITTGVKPIYRHSYTADHLIVDLAKGKVTPLSANGSQQVPSFSPDGRMVAFVRDNNLFIVDLEAKTEKQITHDGKAGEIINGIPDWVYEEEFAFDQAYAWSPKSDYVAFYRFDEKEVKTYNMNIFGEKLYPENYTFKYPKAGEKNSIITIHTYSVKDGTIKNMEIGTETDQYIPRITWNGNKLSICRVNRLQNEFDLLMVDPETGISTAVYNEKNPRYVERIDDETVTFLGDGDRFIVKSEADGYTHLYLYSIKKGLVNQLTKGAWDVTSILGIDEKTGKVYYMSCEGSPLRRNLYLVDLKGRGKKRLTPLDGTYRIDFGKGFNYYISYFSNITTPNQVTLHKADGTLVRTLEDNAALKTVIADYQPPVKEFFTFTTSDGIDLNGYIIKPHDYDSTRRYPLFMTQYSGPGSQQVADRWSMSWENALVQEGYIVACVDGRGTGFRGENFKKCTYRNLGKHEVEDQIEAARYFGSLPFVDRERIGIYGWSYGGFMSLNCILQGADVFKMAIAVAPVTSWRFYDTIYTEIYNDLPQNNPEGYDANSPITHAAKLKGRLLLAHGTGDDNVHVSNSMEMIRRLVKEGKQFDMHIYPDGNHGMGRGYDNLIVKCIDFTKANL